MTDDNLEKVQLKASKKKNKIQEPVEEIPEPKNIDLKAAHRKVMMVMIGLFLAILALMLLMQNHVEFASTGGI